MSTSKTKNNTHTIVLVGLMAAIICIMGPWSLPLPFSPVPISLTNLAIYLTVYILGRKLGSCSYGIYLLLGLVGLPVFSAFTSGPAKLLGPTGGYLIGFVFMAYICGFFIERWENKRVMCLIGMVIGTGICYLFGTVWLAYQAGLDFEKALMAGVIPFLPGDLIKIGISALLGPELRKPLKKAGLI